MILSRERVMPLTTNLEACSDDSERWGKRALCSEDEGVALFRRALVEQTDEAWSTLQHDFAETVRRWLRSHPYMDVALGRDSEENYIALTFSRFWYAVRDQRLEFTSLSAALCYLRATLNGIILDTVRCHLRSRSREIPFPETGCSAESLAGTPLDSQSIWHSIQSLLSDERERRLAYLLYYCGLKPRDIVLHCPGEFDDVKDIYRLNHTIVKRLRRNRDRLRYVLGDTV